MKKLIQGNFKVCCQYLHFLQHNRLFTPDAPVGTVGAYVKDVGYLVYHRQVLGKLAFDLLKDLLLQFGRFHG